MIYFYRGATVDFSEFFYDANGLPASVDSATLTIIFPSSTPSANLLSHDPGRLKGKATIAATPQPDGSWDVSWDSSISDDGTVFWSIKSTDGKTLVLDGSFVLRANLANMEA